MIGSTGDIGFVYVPRTQYLSHVPNKFFDTNHSTHVFDCLGLRVVGKIVGLTRPIDLDPADCTADRLDKLVGPRYTGAERRYFGPSQ